MLSGLLSMMQELHVQTLDIFYVLKTAFLIVPSKILYNRSEFHPFLDCLRQSMLFSNQEVIHPWVEIL